MTYLIVPSRTYCNGSNCSW